jgi:hypothetical protein
MNIRRVRTLTWLLWTVGTGWVVLSFFILSLVARASVPAQPQLKNLPSTRAALLSHVEQQEQGNSAPQKSGVTWITAGTAPVLIQAKSPKGRDQRS